MKGFVVIASAVLFGLAGCCLAPFITPCRETDEACLKSSTEKAVQVLAAGIPSMGIEILDPLLVDQIRIREPGLDMDLRNTTVTGLKRCKVLNLKRQGYKTYLDLQCAMTLAGDYTVEGELLIIPVEGHGKYTIKINDIVIKIVFYTDEEMRNGDNYRVVKKWKHTCQLQKRLDCQFMNLFNGDKQRSDAVHQFVNENWQLFREVGLLKAIVSKLMKEAAKLFDYVPINELVIY